MRPAPPAVSSPSPSVPPSSYKKYFPLLKVFFVFLRLPPNNAEYLTHLMTAKTFLLSEASSREASLKEASLSEASLSEASSWEALLREASLRQASKSEASLREASLREALISEASSREASLSEASFSEEPLWCLVHPMSLPGPLAWLPSCRANYVPDLISFF